MTRNFTIVLAASASALAIAASQAAAQERGLEEIVVTAQRREERLQTVPVAVTALSNAELESAGIRDLTRLDVVTPGFTVGATGSDSRPALRGVKTDNSRQAQADASVAFFIDGVYQSSNQQALAGFLDVARVEVQRGPQGTLYGRNSFGGNVSVVTNLPTDKLGGYITGEYGSFNRTRVEAMANVPVDEKFAFRVVGSRDKDDGYVQNLFPGAPRLEDRNDWYVRGTAKWNPSDKFEAIVRGNYWAQNGAGGGAYEYKTIGTLVNKAQPFLANGQLNVDITGVPIYINPRARASDGLPALANRPAGSPVPEDPYVVNEDGPFGRKLREKAVSLEINYDFNFATAKWITAYNDFSAQRVSDSDFSEFHIRGDTQISLNKTTTTEFQLASPKSETLQWIVGLYYLHTKASEDFIQFRFVSNSLNASTLTQFGTNSYAGYAQVTYPVTDQLRVTAGARFTSDHKDTGGTDRTVPLNFPYEKATFNKATWRAAVDYRVDPDKMLYASVSSGFRSGGFNTGVSAPAPQTFGPEKVTAIEAGAKTRWLENRLQVNAALFLNKFTDLQVVSFDPNTALVFTQNVGKETAKGIELEVVAKPVQDLTISVNGSYLDAYYTKFVAIDPIAFDKNISAAGNQVAMSPHWRGGIAAEYAFHLGNLGTLTPRLQATLTSHYYLLDFNTPIELQKGYVKTDARLTYLTPDERFSLEGYVNNISNRAVKTGGEYGGRGAFFVGYAPPREFGIIAGYKF